MNHQKVVLSLSLLFLICGGVSADSISSSIVCTGASWVSSSVIGADHSFSQNLFTTDPAQIVRNLIVGDSVQAQTQVQSAGPMGVDEYSTHVTNQTQDFGVCLFEYPHNTSLGYQETRVLGLLTSGEYSASQTLTDKTQFLMQVNGSGILMTRAQSSDANQTLSHASDVAGSLNMTEMMRLGGDNVN